MYPITVDILYQVFGSHGIVEKIVIFSKTKGLQALIQYNSVAAATSAKDTLNGQNVSFLRWGGGRGAMKGQKDMQRLMEATCDA
jgi:hypothetical protein